MKLLRLSTYVLLLALAAFSLPCLADNCNGRWTNVTVSSETLEVAKGHTVTFFVARGSTTSDNSPMNAVGECGGYFVSTPDGKTRAAGVCTRKGKDGDSESDTWSMEPGAERGTWKMVGGTGTLAGKNFSGWWQPLVDDGKATTGIWGGNCN
jgi:hypothetical protein